MHTDPADAHLPGPMSTNRWAPYRLISQMHISRLIGRTLAALRIELLHDT
jgi:hypothetical protein